ncbi:hypothetical protein [Nevskia sp.]|uniref:hypothetical protein n=1 Tax=Nevskia sp. TaxID=1929292 RepID=UPI0025D16F5B|nr:hypothetical protein [Nevskia sp.]
MRYGIIIVGLVVAALGIAALLGKFEYEKTSTLAQVGDLKAEVKHDKTVPQWAGILALVVGGGLVLVGFTRKA